MTAFKTYEKKKELEPLDKRILMSIVSDNPYELLN